ISTNDEFLELKAGKPWVITAMLGDASTLRFFGIARRIERNGKFAGVVAAYMAADALSDVWGQLALGPGSSVNIIRRDGWLVTRFPVPDKALNISDQEMFSNQLPKSPEGVFTSRPSPIDNLVRLVAYTTLEDLGLIVT